MSSIRPTSSNRVVNEEKIAQRGPRLIWVVGYLERVHVVGVLLGHSQGPSLHPECVHTCGAGATIHINNEWGVGCPRVGRLEEPIEEIVVVLGSRTQIARVHARQIRHLARIVRQLVNSVSARRLLAARQLDLGSNVSRTESEQA
jgi:hypothetical protein